MEDLAKILETLYAEMGIDPTSIPETKPVSGGIDEQWRGFLANVQPEYWWVARVSPEGVHSVDAGGVRQC